MKDSKTKKVARRTTKKGLTLPAGVSEERLQKLANKRIAYVVLHDSFVEGQGWRLAICVEGEKGYSPTGTGPFTGAVGESRPFFVRGTYEEAQKRVEELNRRMGIEPKEAALIVAGTF